MFNLLKDMHSTCAKHTLKAIASALTTMALQNAKFEILNRKWHTNFKYDDAAGPTLDQRNEEDGNAKGAKENPFRTQADDVKSESSIDGREVPMSFYKQAEICDGLRTYTVNELAAYTEDAYYLPQNYAERMAYLMKDDIAFEPVRDADQTKRLARLLKKGKITEAQLEATNKASAVKFAAPFKAHGAEILAIVDGMGNVKIPGQKMAWEYSDADFERLPYISQQRLMDKVADSLDKEADRMYVQSVNGKAPNGMTGHELEADAILLEKEAEKIRKYRVQWHKDNLHHLDHEEEVRAQDLVARTRMKVSLKLAA